MPLTVLSPEVNEQVSPADFCAQAVTGGGGTGGGGRQATMVLSGSVAQMPLEVLWAVVSVEASPTAVLVQVVISGSGGGGTQTSTLWSGSVWGVQRAVFVSAVNGQ